MVAAADDWFKVHAVAPGVFAISEPRQYEGVTSFLIVGSRRAVLFDTGLGVVGIDRVVRQLTAMPVTVINSHTHFDHVGGNRGFADVRNLDLPFSVASARGQVGEALREYASDTLAEDRVCGPLPDGVGAATTRSRPGAPRAMFQTAKCWISEAGAVRSRSFARPDIRPTRWCCSTARTGCCLPATPTIPARSTCGRRRRTWATTRPRSTSSPASYRN